MTAKETALAVYVLTRTRRRRVYDDDLLRFQVAYPDMTPLLEELQAWRSDDE